MVAYFAIFNGLAGVFFAKKTHPGPPRGNASARDTRGAGLHTMPARLHGEESQAD